MSIFSHGMREILLLSHLLRPQKHPDMHVLPLTHWPTYFSTPNEGLQFNVVVFFFVFFLCQSPPYLLGRQSESEREREARCCFRHSTYNGMKSIRSGSFFLHFINLIKHNYWIAGQSLKLIVQVYK